MDGFVLSASQKSKRQERKLGLFKVKAREKADSYEGEIGLKSTFLQGKRGSIWLNISVREGKLFLGSLPVQTYI